MLVNTYKNIFVKIICKAKRLYKKRRALFLLTALVISFLFIFISCADEPVADDYFNDQSKILGRGKPGLPDLNFTDACRNSSTGKYEIIMAVGCGANTGIGGICYDDDGDKLIFLIYSSPRDPAGFRSESEYYDEMNYCCWADTAGNKKLYSSSGSPV